MAEDSDSRKAGQNDQTSSLTAAMPAAGSPADQPVEKRSSAPSGPPNLAAVGFDLAAFTQLRTAVQQSGLMIGTDAIIAARDREYRQGHYQRAFDMIEVLSMQLNAQAARRQGELRREETQYRAGTLKIPPRQWLERQRRATEQTQTIERARRQFARVLDGLNALRAASAQ
jgi:hypothetical protein